MGSQGPQPGAYTGYLPNSDEAAMLLNDAVGQKAITSLSGEILTLGLDKRELKINLSIQADQLRYSILQLPLFGKARYAIQGNCLIAALNEQWVYIIDLENETLLSQYVNE